MSTACELECRPSLRAMTFREAVLSFYERSQGKKARTKSAANLLLNWTFSSFFLVSFIVRFFLFFAFLTECHFTICHVLRCAVLCYDAMSCDVILCDVITMQNRTEHDVYSSSIHTLLHHPLFYLYFYLYFTSISGRVLLVAVKYKESIIINPSRAFHEDIAGHRWDRLIAWE